MSDRSESLATIAEYFRIGLIVGLVTPAQVSAWADSVIAAEAEPPHEFIELAWSRGLQSTVDALASIKGDRDNQTAGRWLLGLLRESLVGTEEGLQLATQRAMAIARHAKLGDDLYYRFDGLDDELSLARTKVYGTIEQCRTAIKNELSGFPTVDFGVGCA